MASDRIRSTTVLLLRRDTRTVMAADGQMTAGNTIIKGSSRKVRRAGKGKVLVGFAGGAADGLALYGRLESKLEEYAGNLERAVVELAKDWRTDRSMRRLEAQMLVADHRKSFYVNGAGELMEPDETGLLGIGSGSPYALAAARALLVHTELDAESIVREAMKIAADICIYTNHHLVLEELSADGD
jgi:ATP-dependent HslUV protease, peptidase subunit HslV